MSRRRWLRWAVVAIVALFVLYGAASWQAGRIAQERITAWVAQVNQALSVGNAGDASPVTLHLASYQRGFFSSQIQYLITFRDAAGREQTLAMEDALQHGPWPLGALAHGFWRPLAAYSRITPASGGLWQEWQSLLPPGSPAWLLQSRIGFDGRTEAQWRFFPIDASDQGVRFSGGLAKIRYDARTGSSVVDGQWDALMLPLAGGPGSVRVQGVQFVLRFSSGEVNRQLHQRWRVGRFELLFPGSAIPLTLQEQSLALDASQTGQLIDGQFEYQAKQVRLADHDLGRLQCAAALEQVDGQALASFMHVLDQVGAQRQVGADLTSDEQEQLRAALVPVLATSPQLSLRSLRWETTEGASELKTQAAFQPVTADAPADLGGLIEQAIRHVSADLRLSKPMLLQLLRQSQTPQDADMAVAFASMMFDRYAARLERAGLVRQLPDGQVQSSLTYAGGAYTVNGVRLTPDELSQRLDNLQLLPF